MVNTVRDICGEKKEYLDQFYLNYKSIHPLLAENDENFNTLFSSLVEITDQQPPSKNSISRDKLSENLRKIVDELDSFLDDLSRADRKGLLQAEEAYQSFLTAAEEIVDKYS